MEVLVSVKMMVEILKMTQILGIIQLYFDAIIVLQQASENNNI